MSFECIECGYSSAKWLGRCPQCMEWDTFEEIAVEKSSKRETTGMIKTSVKKLNDIKTDIKSRLKSGLVGFDRIIGEGVVKGQVVLIGGPPGVGKSTLFLQLTDKFGGQGKKVMYISGEENPGQIKITADRIGVKGDDVVVIGTSDISEIRKVTRQYEPDILFVDSIQAVVDSNQSGSPGSVSQVKKCGHELTAVAKNTGSVIFMSGQITKQGRIAGPKVLEHIVDTVIYMDILEGNIRIMSAVKNRFGSCGDFVMLSLNSKGLKEMTDSINVIGERNKKIVGQASSCIRTGSRLIDVNLQSLIVDSYFEYPLRRTSGFSRKRLLMLTAMASRHLGLKLGNSDVYLNVSGGTRVNERTTDLGVIGAVYSSFKNTGISTDWMFLGEVGLSGEVHPVKDIDTRVNYGSKKGFKKIILSGYGQGFSGCDSDIEKVYIRNIRQLKQIIN
ncbi:MAG: ATPase domain-containing protein [Elusimicrobiota bacterium]